MTLSGMANVLAVIQGQIGVPITPLGILMRMMKKEVLLASLLGLALKPVVVRAASNPAMEDMLTRLGKVQTESLERDEAQHVEREQLKPITTQYPRGGQFKILCVLTEKNPDEPVSARQVYHKITNSTKKLRIHKKVQH